MELKQPSAMTNLDYWLALDDLGYVLLVNRQLPRAKEIFQSLLARAAEIPEPDKKIPHFRMYKAHVRLATVARLQQKWTASINHITQALMRLQQTAGLRNVEVFFELMQVVLEAPEQELQLHSQENVTRSAGLSRLTVLRVMLERVVPVVMATYHVAHLSAAPQETRIAGTQSRLEQALPILSHQLLDVKHNADADLVRMRYFDALSCLGLNDTLFQVVMDRDITMALMKLDEAALVLSGMHGLQCAASGHGQSTFEQDHVRGQFAPDHMSHRIFPLRQRLQQERKRRLHRRVVKWSAVTLATCIGIAVLGVAQTLRMWPLHQTLEKQ
jgi:hypothetical protein